MKTRDHGKTFPSAFICTLILALSLQAIGTALVNAFPIAVDMGQRQYGSLNFISMVMIRRRMKRRQNKSAE